MAKKKKSVFSKEPAKEEEPTQREKDITADPGTVTKPEPEPEKEAPGLSEDGPVIYFSKRLNYKIGRIPTTVTYELRGKAKHKKVNKGEKIEFVGGRYICKDEEERLFLEDFMVKYPGRLFKVDPQQKKLEMELAAVIARHKTALGTSSKGKQGATG